MLDSLTRREKLLTAAALLLVGLFAVDLILVTPLLERRARQNDERTRLLEQRIALLPYGDETTIDRLVREADRLEAGLERLRLLPPPEPTHRLVPSLVEESGPGLLRFIGLERDHAKGDERLSLSLFADHRGVERLLRRIDRSRLRLVDLSLHKTEQEQAPLAIGVTLERENG